MVKCPSVKLLISNALLLLDDGCAWGCMLCTHFSELSNLLKATKMALSGVCGRKVHHSIQYNWNFRVVLTLTYIRRSCCDEHRNQFIHWLIN